MFEEKLWKIFREQEGDREIPESAGTPTSLQNGLSRRTFIEMIGFSAAAVALSGCKAPEQKVLPFLKQPVELTPGVASWYASTCGGCSAACGVLVKVRDGRPIKLEGNPDHPLSQGGLCATAHGMVFSLYDSDRLRQPWIHGQPSSWEEVDRQVQRQLLQIGAANGTVRLLTPTVHSPASRQVIDRFLSQFKEGRHVIFDAVSYSAITQAHQLSHQLPVTPQYHLDHARLVISFGADFLGTWLSPVQFTRGYTQARHLRDGGHEMLRHIQFESRMSLTGGNADRRIAVSPAEEIEALLLLAQWMAIKTGASGAVATDLLSFAPKILRPTIRQAVDAAAQELSEHRGRSLVLSGSNDTLVQYTVNFINHLAGNYGTIIDLNAASRQYLSRDADMVELVGEMQAGRVAALLVAGVNPVYNYYAPEDFRQALTRVPLTISFNPAMDETTVLTDFICPTHHFLEAWDDAEPVRGTFSLNQPAIAPLFHTRAYQETLLRWSGEAGKYYDVLREYWNKQIFTKQNLFKTFDEFWDHSLQAGVFVMKPSEENRSSFHPGLMMASVVGGLKSRVDKAAGKPSIFLYEKLALRDGTHANNPWLQELPDPITKITWDNYANVSPAFALTRHLREGQVLRISREDTSLEVPIHIQPGHQDECISLAVGYGRTEAGKVANQLGVNAFPLVRFEEGTFQYETADIRLEPLDRIAEFAKTQTGDSQEGRPLVRQLSFEAFLAVHTEKIDDGGPRESLWPGYQYSEHKWGLVVDLNACTGCSACILSCQSENNIPVVGKDEVRRRREMHWLRIDRYYDGSTDNPEVAFQPVACYQCDNASCESVCPVLATVHSNEGLNMQVYNRCVGTRYCENNCAYKVRRFNWFNHDHSDPYERLALNPDVTVRSRGVMEKCTFCVQRIEEVKIKARNEGRVIQDGEIQTACQQSCPAGAIIFGDLLNVKSRAAQLKQDPRNYVLLEELNLHPALSYLSKVRNG